MLLSQGNKLLSQSQILEKQLSPRLQEARKPEEE